MFEVGDRVKFKDPKKCDHNTYHIVGINEIKDPNGTSMSFYNMIDEKSGKRKFFGVNDTVLTMDKNYMRRKKIEKIYESNRRCKEENV